MGRKVGELFNVGQAELGGIGIQHEFGRIGGVDTFGIMPSVGTAITDERHITLRGGFHGHGTTVEVLNPAHMEVFAIRPVSDHRGEGDDAVGHQVDITIDGWRGEGIVGSRAGDAVDSDAGIDGYLMRAFLEDRDGGGKFEASSDVVVNVHQYINEAMGIGSVGIVIADEAYRINPDVRRDGLVPLELRARGECGREEKD